MSVDRVTEFRGAILNRYAREDFGQDTALLEQELTALVGADEAEEILLDLAEMAEDYPL